MKMLPQGIPWNRTFRKRRLRDTILRLRDRKPNSVKALNIDMVSPSLTEETKAKETKNIPNR